MNSEHMLTVAEFYHLHHLENVVLLQAVDGGEATSAAIDDLHEAEKRYGVFGVEVECPRWQKAPSAFAPGPTFIELNLVNYSTDDVEQLNDWAINAHLSQERASDVLRDSITQLSLVTWILERSGDPAISLSVVNAEIDRLRGLLVLLRG